MKVKIQDGVTFDVMTESAWLEDVIPDDNDRWFAAQELRNTGRCWIGGGAAPLVYLTVILR